MEKGRLEAFSDGVIAIITTIMALEMKVPHGADLESLKPLIEECAKTSGSPGAKQGRFVYRRRQSEDASCTPGRQSEDASRTSGRQIGGRFAYLGS
jgi:hypothetical protein